MLKPSPKIEYVVGIDESGRGPLAGPVVVGVVAVRFDVFKTSFSRYFKNVQDPKKTTIMERDKWHSRLKEWEEKDYIQTGFSFVGPQVIDNTGIVRSIKKALDQSLKKLNLAPEKTLVLLDGLLHAKDEYIHQETIIKGDEKEPIITLAAIIAKVARDRKMVQLAKKFPQYGLDVHKGYGTKAHRDSLKKHGLSSIHRYTFLKKFLKKP